MFEVPVLESQEHRSCAAHLLLLGLSLSSPGRRARPQPALALRGCYIHRSRRALVALVGLLPSTAFWKGWRDYLHTSSRRPDSNVRSLFAGCFILGGNFDIAPVNKRRVRRVSVARPDGPCAALEPFAAAQPHRCRPGALYFYPELLLLFACCIPGGAGGGGEAAGLFSQ